MRKRRKGTALRFGLLALFAAAGLVWLGTGEETRAASGGSGAETTCFECHDDHQETFAQTVHGRADLGAVGTARCELCHGSGTQHIETGGEAAILNPATAPADAVAQNCLRCHGNDAASHWQASSHADFDVSCTKCHTVHTPWTNEKAQRKQNVNETCLSCHQEMRKHLYQRSSHPLRDGHMTCVDCHSPHGSNADASIAALSPNEKCYECHAEKRGPFLFEHAPVREDCMNCHDPHGSNQTMLLKTAPPRLCQSCHLFGHHQTVPGTAGQVWNQNRSCVNCHPRIHGSNHPSGVIFMR